MFDYERCWAADSETYAHDNFWVFINIVSGECVRIHNNNSAIAQFIEDYDPILVGYNLRDYDQHILKANLLGYSPEEIKEVSEVMITANDGFAIYEYFQNEGWVDIPPLIDLIHDIVGKPSLKQLEGYMGSSIEECSVPFDIDRPLTDNEIEDVLTYCEHDVKNTLNVWELRQDYINSKARMCSILNVDPLDELKHPMPRVVADLLRAEKQYYDNEDYVIPDDVCMANIPSPVYWFAKHLDRDEGLHTTKKSPGNAHNVVFEFHDCVAVMGVGGMHAAKGNLISRKRKNSFNTTAVATPYHEKSDENRVLLIQDFSAYYPNLIVKCGYMSRSVPATYAPIYEEFIKVKDQAKLDGDKLTETAAKLFNNILSGTLRSEYNKLSDPMQGISLCVTGQLYLLDLIERIHQDADSANLVQMNTDGWVLSVDRNQLSAVLNVVDSWCETTGLRVDTDEVREIWQRDVNNYIMLLEDGSIHVKGGTVGAYYGKDRNWIERGFVYSNSIIDKAIVDNLVNGTAIEDTMKNETDLSRFQIIAKPGNVYPNVYKDCFEVLEVIPPTSKRKVPRVLEVTRGEIVNRVNRIYATKDQLCGQLMKEHKSGKLHPFPDTPRHAFVDNKNTEMTLDMLDLDWYTELAKKKLAAFIGGSMSKVKDEQIKDEGVVNDTTVAKKTATVKVKKVEKKEVKKNITFEEKYLAFQRLLREALSGVEPGGYIDNINYEYIPTPEYRDVVAYCAQEAGLIYSTTYENLEWLGVLEKTSRGTNTYGCIVECIMHFSDTSDYTPPSVTHQAYGMGIGTGGNCVSSAHTNALRNIIVNGLLAKSAFDDDVMQANKNETEAAKAPKAYVSDDKKEQMKTKLKADTKRSVISVQEPAAMDVFERATEALTLDTISDKQRKAFEAFMSKYYEDGKPKKDNDGNITLTSNIYLKCSTSLDEIGV